MVDLTARSLPQWSAAAAALRIEGRAFIDGAFVAAASGRVFDVVSPIDGRTVAEAARGEAADIDRAVASGRAAFEDGRWRHLDPKAKKRILLRLAELMRADTETLALLETLDTGRPIGDSLAVDVPLSADCLQYYAELADKLFDEIAPTGPNDLALVRREPLGVVGCIVPWNYPLLLTCWKIAPALLAGNSVVVKPAEQSPLSALRLAELALEAGLPPGVLNVVPGTGPEAGKPLALHGDVDAIGFTGSTAVGKLMLTYAGQSNAKRVGLELGGKSPQIVCADADLAQAATDIAWAMFYNAGQTCHAGSRVIAHRSIKDRLLAEVEAVAATIALGHPLDPATKLGALIDAGHMARVLGYIDSGRQEGAQAVLGGRQARSDSGGFYIEATVLDGVRNDMKVAREEIFGPVLSVLTFDDEAEALHLANDTVYGLAAGIWTADMNRAHRLSSAVRAGSVWINTYDRNSLATPFGGFKQSGSGRDRSVHALDKYSDLKTIWTAYR